MAESRRLSLTQRRKSKVQGGVKSRKPRNPSQLCHWEARRPSTLAQPCWEDHGAGGRPGSPTGGGDNPAEGRGTAKVLRESKDEILTRDGTGHPEPSRQELSEPPRAEQAEADNPLFPNELIFCSRNMFCECLPQLARSKANSAV